MIRRFVLPLILFIIIVLEGVALELLPLQLLSGDYFIVPHWLFIFLVYIAVFFDHNDTYYSVLYALIFGLLFDIVYTGILGVYMFSYALVIYIVHGIKKMLQGNFYVLLLLATFGIVLIEFTIYGIFSVVGMIDISLESFILNRLAPTILLNLVFLIVIYPFSSKRLEKWKTEIPLGERMR
ncbi:MULTISPECIES: rod shape-determining protein MreD [Oceanobacillus]|uniref:Rod shape-determining protein MreD n=1 Tax=Oceanobacillus kimchii TaxID=746691 RepID=A0ABQ5TIL7_9BACI|nr:MULTISPECIES: rod shape-determining protein MreD [Oceanobacillus]MBT2598190.1 rod shape-determining protein MreD [Oceanobacillus sp. ISL-74]MBT2651109.1 rod shape-determining protein MreD [Oceanobacillus sp. ISL-73]MCT1575773.1 rod shape-determining protein MreD [Oceanobacillus kimchii]MCT2135410.1 rod shape-determining protein MreD [Oceanobacillus kimchii]OEH55517.1 rod shape-determining protein MreD [Oceanobacillus sp. E9]